MKRLVFAILAAAGLAACHIDDYCVGAGCPGANGDGGGTGSDGGGTIDGNDGAVPPDACIPTGAEMCNGLDDDCNGTADDNAAMVGEVCSNNVGDCHEGVWACNGGELECAGGTLPTAEICDTHDNDCDGTADNGNPGGGEFCGSNVGECHAGLTQCVDGDVICNGQIGMPGAVDEICDSKDNDCDGAYDEDVPTNGDCGYPAVGQCVPGALTCFGGQYLCVGGTGPSFELCDTAGVDQDCDGNDHNGYDWDNDVRNCGACQHSCIGTIDHSTAVCANGQCAPGPCDPDYHDDPNIAGPDCEYHCVFAGPNEACNNLDDDCDGFTDEDLVPPSMCNQTGACANTVATCDLLPDGIHKEWACNYGGNVSTDANGDIVPESTCDDIDNDCNGIEDDPFTAELGTDCVGSGVGICQDRGHVICDPNDATQTTCNDDDPSGITPGTVAEACNGLDDNCDGTVDNGGPAALNTWVTIGNNTSIMKYEANKPVGESYVCDAPGATPWTMVTAPEAELACETVGARLCTEQEWNRACSMVTGTSWPFTELSANNGKMVFEAEDFYSRANGTANGTLRAWVPDYTSGYSGISALAATPNLGDTVGQGSVNGASPRLDFKIRFTTSGNHYVWVRMYTVCTAVSSPCTQTDIGVHVGYNASLTAPTATMTATNGSARTWQFRRVGPFTVAAADLNVDRYISLWMQDDGVKVDEIVVTRSNSTTAPTDTTTNGGDWSFDSSPDTYAGGTCNGHDYSATDDNLIATGSATHCNAPWPSGNGGGVFDMSGNVKEWTAARLPGENPIRGGASNNIAGGLTCSSSFTLGSNSFFFNNVGFRCCK